MNKICRRIRKINSRQKRIRRNRSSEVEIYGSVLRKLKEECFEKEEVFNKVNRDQKLCKIIIEK